ncbi:hypothetical protein [Mechercharimyces sp. CAU 1602]|uniref:hypothetical protein n=1 Tax=Mechercharimyces sp. CAU 1602 TaxID=2973933 RepID=UPI00216152C9|nr:hypothetical protein [Mechercharimyces sp. CAU 1602]MCS1351022.1 hypothetical protein [Mechercharimyces sp. CAU 1602]
MPKKRKVKVDTETSSPTKKEKQNKIDVIAHQSDNPAEPAMQEKTRDEKDSLRVAQRPPPPPPPYRPYPRYPPPYRHTYPPPYPLYRPYPIFPPYVPFYRPLYFPFRPLY